MSVTKKQEQNYKLATAMTVAVFCMGQIPGSIDAAISKITEYFHLSSTSGLYVTTVASLVSVAFSLLLGFVAGKRIGFKPLIFFCATVELVSAIAPFFTSNFVAILILRGLFGIGFGGMQSLENTVATRLIPVEKRVSILGIGTFFGFGMNCILQYLGGVLAETGWNYVFLNHFLLIVPYAIVVMGCMRLSFGDDRQETRAPSKHAANRESQKEKLPGSVFLTWFYMFVMGMMIAPLLIGCSFLSAPINDSAAVAGIVAVCFSVGCMVGGISYAKIFQKVRKYALAIFLLLTSAGILGCALTRNIIVLCIMIFLAGIGFSSTQATSMMTLGLLTPKSKIALASAIMMALFNLGMFLSSPYEALIGSLTGDSLYMPLFIGFGVLIVLTIVYVLRSPFRNYKDPE